METELEYFEENKKRWQELMKKPSLAGEPYVVIAQYTDGGATVIGFHYTRSQAEANGLKQCGDKPFLVKNIFTE